MWKGRNSPRNTGIYFLFLILLSQKNILEFYGQLEQIVSVTQAQNFSVKILSPFNISKNITKVSQNNVIKKLLVSANW